VVDKLCHTAIILIVFLAVADEDVVFITGDNTCHNVKRLERLIFRFRPVFQSNLRYYRIKVKEGGGKVEDNERRNAVPPRGRLKG